MFFLKRENGCRNIFMTKSPRKKKCPPYGRSRVRLQQEIVYELATDRANATVVVFLLHVLGIYMCTELVPIFHTRENLVPDLHMCDEYSILYTVYLIIRP